MSWPIVKLGEVCETNPARTQHGDNEEVLFVPMASVREQFQNIAMPELRPWGKVKRGYTAFLKGDLLFAKITPCFQNGKAWIATGDGAGSTEFHVFRANPERLSVRYLFFFLAQDAVIKEGLKTLKGTAGQQRIAINYFSTLSLPLPSLPEQKRIVEELEWKLARLEKIEGNFRAMAETAAQASRSVLTGTFRSLDAPIVKLGDVCDCLDALRIPITKCDRKPGNVPYYGATGIQDYVAGHLFNEPLVLLGEDGAKWGAGERSAFLVEGKSWVNNHVHVLRPTDSLLTSFLIAYLNAIDLTKWVSGVTVPKLTQSRMKQIPLPLPSLPEQHQIVEELEWKLSRLEKVERLAREGLTVCEQARWAVLAEAFRQADGTALRQGCNAAGQAEQPAT